MQRFDLAAHRRPARQIPPGGRTNGLQSRFCGTVSGRSRLCAPLFRCAAPARIEFLEISMSLQCGIVGLPNVGKSTLFNALTKAGIAAENYPFCTIEPNVGVVEVPDP